MPSGVALVSVKSDRVSLGLDPHRDDDGIDAVLLEPGVADQ
jgi:hypothetical protein